MSKAHPIFERVFKTYDKLNNVVQENLRGIRVVKSFVREDYEKEKFGTISEDIYSDFSKAEKDARLQHAAHAVLCFCEYAADFVVRRAFDRRLHHDDRRADELNHLYDADFNEPDDAFYGICYDYHLRASAERIVEVLNEESDLHNPKHPVYEVKDGAIRFDNVEFSYKKGSGKPCLKGINLTINAGETVGIIGGTGSSKSSLVQLIPRLYDVTEGSVSVGGVDVRDYDIETLRNEVAMVLQKTFCFPEQSKENLRWGSENATDEELVHACKLAQADGFITQFPDGYDTYIEQGGTNVSGGQKQRLCIARALLKKPKILILDDSTSAVDTQTDAQIRQAMRDEIPVQQSLLSRSEFSIEDADKIIVLDEGEINAVGTHEELLETNEIYREVYTSQQKGGLAMAMHKPVGGRGAAMGRSKQKPDKQTIKRLMSYVLQYKWRFFLVLFVSFKRADKRGARHVLTGAD